MREEGIPPLYDWKDWSNWKLVWIEKNHQWCNPQDERSRFLAKVTGMKPVFDGSPAVESPLGRIELHLLP